LISGQKKEVWCWFPMLYQLRRKQMRIEQINEIGVFKLSPQPIR